MTRWTGVFPAVTTKLKQDESVDLAATQDSLDRLIKNGVSGVIVLPMLGENASLTAAERESVILAAKEAVAGRVPLLSGLAHVGTADALASARHYEKLGAEGLMAFPSIAYKSDLRETAAWYRTLGTGCGLPIMIYNNPIAYGVDVTPAILNDLADVRTSSASRRRPATSAASPTSTTNAATASRCSAAWTTFCSKASRSASPAGCRA